MLTIRRLLPGEERDYNSAVNTGWSPDGELRLVNSKGEWAVMIVGDGATIVESADLCSVRFRDGGRTTLIEALEEILEKSRDVRHARVVARRALREMVEDE